MTAEDAANLDEKTQRFVLRRRIGEGAFGVVWEAYDREQHARVALKSLVNAEPAALYLFKREFRALADIVHPNLVTLYELLSIGERWFFTMEFVDGVDFVSHVTHSSVVIGPPPEKSRRASLSASGRIAGAASGSSLSAGKNGGPNDWYDQPTLLDALNEEEEDDDEDSDPTMQVHISPAPFPAVSASRFDADRLRAALRQLAAGLSTLHDAGKLHRDIKPSNVLVTREGRVVILDFGLIADLSPGAGQRSPTVIVGTPVFMSPEQGVGGGLTPASDWYSVGVMLYAALTGKVPFDGPPMHVLLSKTEVDPPPPSRVAQGVPPDLDALCVDLLRRNPKERPSGRDVLRRLGDADAMVMSSPPSPAGPSRLSLFVGRERHIAALRAAFADARRGSLAAALVHGRSGMGKSSLIRYFLTDLKARHPEAVILTGRCYQRESVPYKALDSLVDELSVYLQGLPTRDAAALMPRGVEALARLFPVLRQVETVLRPNAQAPAIADPHELRRRAFGALRELFSRIAARAPLVIFIDDLQWGDADSDALLADIVGPPRPPAILLIASYRTEELRRAPGSEGAPETPLSRALRSSDAPEGSGIVVRELSIGELTFEESERMASALLGADAEGRASEIASEAEGNPLFIDALARHSLFELEEARSSRASRSSMRPPPPNGAPAAELAPESETSPGVPRVNLAGMINARVARLPSGARRLLETVVVAGRPIDAALARRAAGVESHEKVVLSLLQVSHLVRSRADSSTEEVEVYHDRIRDSVLASISPEDLKAYHNRLAITLELDGRADPELLATHYQAADRPDKAAHYARKAADDAFDALAFDRAARLYKLALSLSPKPDVAAQARLGESLANAGRGAEAADAYLAAADRAEPSQALDLRRRAAEQLLLSGHVDRGLAVVRTVLDSLGMKLAETPRGALVSLLTRRTQIWLRGLRFKERSEASVPQEELIRIDTCWAIATGLSLVDNIRGADFQARHLLLALQSGEPYRVARALSLEVAYSASGGVKNRARTEELIRTTQALAERIGHPHAIALATATAGAAMYLAGEWRKGLELAERGAAILRERCSGVAFEIDTTDIFILSALNHLGEWKALSARLRSVVQGARARGDLYAENHSRLEMGWIVDLAADMPDEARRSLDEALARCSQEEGFQMQHGLHLMGAAAIHLYRGEPEKALRLFERHWGDLQRSFMLEIPMAHMGLLDLRARSAIGCASLRSAVPSQQRAWLKTANADIKRMEEEGMGWTNAAALSLRAGVALASGNRTLAREQALAAEAGFQAADMAVHAAVALRRRGELIGGTEGRRLVAEADRRLSAQDIKAPERIAAMLAPGRFSEGN
jgi:serine/threonine protein kinase/tetratricopeptide (TPR) repeat protein